MCMLELVSHIAMWSAPLGRVRLIVSSDLPEVPLALGRECGLGRVDLFRALCVHSRTGEGASTRILPANLPTDERTFPLLLSAKG